MTTLNEPKQDRSKATLIRLMEAVELLMSEQPFEKITLQQIVAKAKTTTGSFYARFPDKNSMLAALFHEHIEAVNQSIKNALEALPSLPPARRIEKIVAVTGDAFRLRPALMRSGTLLFWNRAKGDVTLPEPMAPRAELIGQLENSLATAASDLGSETPEKSAKFALKILLSSSRQHYLFTDDRTILTASDEEFQIELSKLVRSYLISGE